MNITNSHLFQLGKMTIFYIPSHKLDDPRFYQREAVSAKDPKLDLGQTARAGIHQFLIEHFRAYTQTPTPVKGCWVDPAGQLVHDVMERFEVSFENESDFERLIEFLVETCQRIQEEAIYVTRGDRSFLVQRSVSAE